MQILVLLGMYFNAVVVFVTSQTLIQIASRHAVLGSKHLVHTFTNENSEIDLTTESDQIGQT